MKEKNHKPCWYKMYARDWLTDDKVMALDHFQKGVYIDLLNLSWINNGLPNDKQMLKQMLRVNNRNWTKVVQVLDTFFTKSDSKIVNRRQEMERGKYLDMVDKRRTAGSLGGKAKKSHQHENGSKCLPNAKQNCSDTETETETETDLDNNKLLPKENGIQTDDVPGVGYSDKELEAMRIKESTPPCNLDEAKIYLHNLYAADNTNQRLIAERWYESKSAVGWKINGEKIVDWRAALRGYYSRVKDKPEYKLESFMVCTACWNPTDMCECEGEERGKHYESFKVPPGLPDKEKMQYVLNQ
jgi:uncharacterized protein YdaU (DUF1376 family)